MAWNLYSMISLERGSFLPRHAERGYCETNRPSAKAATPCQTNTHTLMHVHGFTRHTKSHYHYKTHNCTSKSKSQIKVKKKLDKENRRTSVLHIKKCVCVCVCVSRPIKMSVCWRPWWFTALQLNVGPLHNIYPSISAHNFSTRNSVKEVIQSLLESNVLLFF